MPGCDPHHVTGDNMIRWSRSGLMLGLLLFVGMTPAFRGLVGQEAPIDYREQIQPLLASHCFSCHGPDAEHREAGLRLDRNDGSWQGVVMPGDPDGSELVRRILSRDPEEQMPPPAANRPLSPEGQELLRRWVAEGAPQQQHWAFEPVRAVAPPETDRAWSGHPIDRFVLARMRSHSLEPAPRADRRTLIRRASFDLTGLPPSAEDLAAFLADPAPDPVAWEKVLDRLLASPRFGEQMAVEWLDAARYADTNGYQNDFVRSQWPWRDWVIDAFNRNLPYDRFIVDQIAGDLLPEPRPDQLIATGFNRNNRSVTEGGSIEEEWRIENCVDRVETTAATFLGLTLGCARCHDHKYDPVSQKDFYRFFAFFNNIDELGVYNEARGNTGPQLELPTPDQTRELARIDARIGELSPGLVRNPAAATGNWLAWRREATGISGGLPRPILQFAGRLDQADPVISPAGTGMQFSGSEGATAPVIPFPAPIERDRPFSWSVWIHGDARGAIFGQMNEDAAYRGLDGLVLPDGRLKIHLIHEWPGRAIAVLSRLPLTPGEWNHLTVTWNGSSQASGLKIYLDGEAEATTVEADRLDGSIATETPFRIGQRSRSEFLRGSLARFEWFDRELSAGEVQGLLRQALVRAVPVAATQPDSVQAEDPFATLAEPARSTLVRYLSGLDRRADRMELAQLQADRAKLVAGFQTVMIMRDRAEYRPTQLLRRGQYDQPETSEDLWPAVPEILPPLGPGQPANRLGLALWMVDARNPLVARVAVNRAWIKLFGRGLVEPADNFGMQGTPPTHPLLLDNLAAGFRESGWDWKGLLRNIMTSETYCQASAVDPQVIAVDPDNRWLARSGRRRLSAEQIRDQALAVSGLLVEQMGGPPVRPYQPEGLWEELAGGANNGPYQLDEGPGLYRRSLYTYRKRTVSHPTVSTFDAPSWEICQIKRSPTNTPLQSLALLNDTTYVEAARKLAERMSQSAGDDPEAAIRQAFRLVLQREPESDELQTLMASLAEYQRHYQANPDQARELLATGKSPVAPDIAPPALASLTAIASTLLNLDETITRE